MPVLEKRNLSLAGCAGAVAVLGHLGPAVTWPPAVRLRMFPALAGRSRAPHVALTFDDGPHPRATPLLLDALAALDVRATFFVVGERAAREPDLVRRAAGEGHEVAVHGWRHTAPLRPWGDRPEIARAARLVDRLTGRPPRWYRPPYGVLSTGRLAAARTVGLRPVLWTVWGRDWTAHASGESTLAELRPGVVPGATVLLHDSDAYAAAGCWRATLRALPELVALVRERGLSIGPLRDHGMASPRFVGVAEG